jgi:hypothetical protein
MGTGIFNPYEKPKENPSFRSATDSNDPADTEYIAPVGNIKLDGDSYVLEFTGIEVEEIADRLGKLIMDAQKNYPQVLKRHGIEMLPLQDPRTLKGYEVSLPTPEGHLCVGISKDNVDDPLKIEVEVFKRIARAFKEIPKELLAAHRARVIMRA